MPVGLSRERVRTALAGPAVLPYARPSPRGAARASVVVALDFEPELATWVVVRSSELLDHAGELGFPGGKPHAGESLEAAALRELEEEVGVAAADVEVLGGLTPIPVITGKFMITPFVAALGAGARPSLASGELVELIRAPLGGYLDGSAETHGYVVDFRGRPFVMPHFRFGERVLFGASALILHELLLRLARELGRALAAPVIESECPWGGRYPDEPPRD